MRAAIASLVLLAGLLAGFWWAFQARDHRYDREILAVARQHGLAPSLVKSVVWRESRFQADARGRHEEIGLMQLQPATAQEWADARRDRAFVAEHLTNPSTNLHAGCFYLSKIVRRYPRTDNPWAYALADYNAGRGNVLRWLKGPAETNSAAFLEAITFPSTQHYVRSILRQAPRYEPDFPR